MSESHTIICDRCSGSAPMICSDSLWLRPHSWRVTFDKNFCPKCWKALTLLIKNFSEDFKHGV